jgi:hypothetical protein
LFLSFVCISFLTYSQSTSTEAAKTTKEMYAEVGGPGVLFSINFDSRFNKGSRTGLGYKAGLGFTLFDKDNKVVTPQGIYYDYRTKTLYTFPLAINYVLAKPNSPNMVEVGVGVTVLSEKASVLNYNEYKEGRFLGHVSFMYRRQPVDGGFSWRIGVTPIINPDGDIFPFAGLGFGYTFK